MDKGPETLFADDGIEYAWNFRVLIERNIRDDHLCQSVHFFGLVGSMRVCKFYAT